MICPAAAAVGSSCFDPIVVADVLAVANQKGGVGKTTSAINLAAAFGAMERRVLLVDCDPQGNASRGVGWSGRRPTLFEVLAGEAKAADVVVATDFPYLDLLPANRDLVGAEFGLEQEANWFRRLTSSLGSLDSAYERILVDCPPALGRLTLNALYAADAVLVPLQCEYFALEGISELVSTVERVRELGRPDLGFAGVVLTMYDERTNLCRDVASEVRRHFGSIVCDTIIPRNVRLAEAPSHGMPVLQYDITSKGSQAYLSLAHELAIRRPR